MHKCHHLAILQSIIYYISLITTNSTSNCDCFCGAPRPSDGARTWRAAREIPLDSDNWKRDQRRAFAGQMCFKRLSGCQSEPENRRSCSCRRLRYNDPTERTSLSYLPLTSGRMCGKGAAEASEIMWRGAGAQMWAASNLLRSLLQTLFNRIVKPRHTVITLLGSAAEQHFITQFPNDAGSVIDIAIKACPNLTTPRS
jgi:hypothetical protein